MGCDDEVVEVLDGKVADIKPSRSYNVLYSNPSLVASIQCLDSVGEAKDEYDKTIKKLEEHPLGLASHEDIGMAVSAIGYWNSEEDSQKQIVFRYGNLLVVVQTLYSSKIPVSEVQDFAAKYLAFLEGASTGKQ
ncbi:hypothetical protein [Haloferula sp.]|uniref:hypothetical protein n=1 Tax=Haloferula sp. TaxID=2497595 RepID=UPI0032A0FA8D